MRLNLRVYFDFLYFLVDDSGLTHSSVETASDNSPTRPSAIGGAANRHVDSVNPGGQGPTNPITPTRGNVGTERTDQPTDHLGNGHKTGGFTEQHTHGHHDKASRDLMPSAGQTHEEEMHRLDRMSCLRACGVLCHGFSSCHA